MVDLYEAKDYLGVTLEDDDLTIEKLIKVSYLYLEGATGVDFSTLDNEKADIFVLALTDELFNNRGISLEKGVDGMKYIYKSILLQLQLECGVNV